VVVGKLRAAGPAVAEEAVVLENSAEWWYPGIEVVL